MARKIFNFLWCGVCKQNIPSQIYSPSKQIVLKESPGASSNLIIKVHWYDYCVRMYCLIGLKNDAFQKACTCTCFLPRFKYSIILENGIPTTLEFETVDLFFNNLWSLNCINLLSNSIIATIQLINSIALVLLFLIDS